MHQFQIYDAVRRLEVHIVKYLRQLCVVELKYFTFYLNLDVLLSVF